MRINGMNNVAGIYKQNNAKRTTKSSTVSGGKDTFAISDTAKELQVAQKAISSASDVRQDRIKEIKQQMEAGTYNISASMIADKLVGKM